jgi:hypothetical protein
LEDGGCIVTEPLLLFLVAEADDAEGEESETFGEDEWIVTELLLLFFADKAGEAGEGEESETGAATEDVFENGG